MMSDLKSLAENVLKTFPLVQSDAISIAKRPFFIEFSGTPKSGKTTIASKLQLFLRRSGFRVRTLIERASVCPLNRKDHIFFNIWTSCTTLTQMLETLEQDDQIIIIDRGLFDSLCWMRWFEKAGRFSGDEKKIIEEFILLNRWRELIDLVFILTVNPSEALSREFSGLKDRRSGSIMNVPTLEQLNSSIQEVHDKQIEIFSRLVKIDTTSVDIQQTVNDITEKTLNSLREFLSESVLVLPKTVLSELGIQSGFINDEELLRRLFSTIRKEGRFMDRTQAEREIDYVQPIAVGYFQYNEQYLLLRRREENPKDRMHEKYVIWAGGHVRKQDQNSNDLIIECLLREVSEELNIKKLPEPQLVGAMLDTSNVASSRHLGIVYKFVLDSSDIMLAMHQKEYKESKGKSVSCNFADVDQLENYYDKMEDWSKMIIVNHLKLFNKQIYHQGVLF